MTRQRLFTLDRQSSQAAGPEPPPSSWPSLKKLDVKFKIKYGYHSLCTLLNLEELVKVEDDSRDVAEEEDADDAYQDGRKVHLFESFKILWFCSVPTIQYN